MAQIFAAKGRELGPWNEFKAPDPVKRGDLSKPIVGTRRVITRKMADGSWDVKVRPVAKGF